MTTTLASLIESLGSSLHSYLAAAGLWTFPGEEQIKLAIVDLVEDQRSISNRAGLLLEQRGAVVPRPAYPIRYTATHDIELGAMLPRILSGLRRQVAECDRLIDAEADPAAIDLVRQARETAIQHGDALEECMRQRIAPSASGAAAGS
ncbi:MAG: hypothetical protein DWH79_02145 [Planctomycetota bacterium]|nr:MAG: hypothetical protein DWH79_02145 [Planctomycetota bacterium]